MWSPYEYSYSVFDFCLIKKMCVRKQWVGGRRSEGTLGVGEPERERGLGEISLADEWEWVMRLTEQCKHLHRLRQPWSMKMMVAWRIKQAGGARSWKRSALRTVTLNLVNGHSNNATLTPLLTISLLTAKDFLKKKKRFSSKVKNYILFIVLLLLTISLKLVRFCNKLHIINI